MASRVKTKVNRAEDLVKMKARLIAHLNERVSDLVEREEEPAPAG